MSIIHDALKKVEKEKRGAPPQVLHDQVESAKEPSVPPAVRKWPLRLFSFGKSVIGIDIGFSSVKAVNLERSRDGYTLKSAGCEDVAPGTGESGVMAALNSLVSRQGLSDRMVSLIVNPASLTIGHVSLPRMPEDDLKKAVIREAKKKIDFPNDAVVDYIVNGEVEEEGKKKLSIIDFTARRSEILRYVDMLKSASLKPAVIDVCPMALLSAFDNNYSWEPNKRYAVVDIGASKTTLAILSRNSLRLVRKIALAGNDVTWSIQEAEQADFASAEEMKLHYSGHKDSAPETVQVAFRSFINDITGELQRSFIYYQAQLREGPVDEILISGGCARIDGLVGQIEETLGIPAVLFNPYNGVRMDKGIHKSADLEALSPLLVGALGLALRRGNK